MTNEEEMVHKFLSTPIRIENFYTELVGLLDQHAAEQRETDIKALRNVCQHFMGHSFNTGSVVLLEDAIRNARVEKSDE